MPFSLLELGGKMTDERAAGSAHAVSHRLGASAWQPAERDLLSAGSPSRRWFMRAGLSGIAGLPAAQLLQLQAEAAPSTRTSSRPKSVILFWLSGGPSHLD